MSESNGKVCCNCRHRIRSGCSSYCEVTGAYLHYQTVMEGWCRHWSKDHRWDDNAREEAHNESD